MFSTYCCLCCSYSDVTVLETYIHLLQLISTSEPGVQALGNSWSFIHTALLYWWLKIKGPNIYYTATYREFEQQRFTIHCGILTSISNRRCDAICGHPLQLERPIYTPAASCTMAFTPQCSLAMTHYFSIEYYRVLTATHLPTQKGWKAELAWAPRSVNNLLKVITRQTVVLVGIGSGAV